MKIGCHISIRHGYLGAARTAVAIGAEAFQFFPKNPRSLTIKAFDAEEAARCAAFCREQGLLSVGHAPYTVNLAQDEGPLREATVASLRNDLAIVDACSSVGIVVHFGKYKGKDPLQGYKNIIQCINDVLNGYEGKARLLIENQAGEGGAMGTTLEELISVRKLCARPEKVGFCFDTCHAFACGLWPRDGWSRLVEQGRRHGYWELVDVLHLNDSAYPAGEGKDRHANIGRGYIGEERFRELLATPEIRGLPAILETAGGPDRTHQAEIKYVRSLQMT